MNNHPDDDPTYYYDQWLASLPKALRWEIEDEQQHGNSPDDEPEPDEEADV